MDWILFALKATTTQFSTTCDERKLPHLSENATSIASILKLYKYVINGELPITDIVSHTLDGEAVSRCELRTTTDEAKIIIIIIASHEDEMNDKYNDKLCTSYEVISEMSEEI